MDAEVGRIVWTQMLDEEFGLQRLDIDVGCRSWMQRLDAKVGHSGWTQRLDN